MKETKDRGITLIALIVTIIILLILAGVTIASLNGENELFVKVKLAKQKYEISEAKEKLELKITELRLEEEGKDETLTKEDLPKLNSDEIDVGSVENFPVQVIYVMYKFNVDENFVVIYVGEANQTIVTYTTEPEGYTNQENILIKIKISNSKGIKKIQYPNSYENNCNGKTNVAIDYPVQKNGVYTFKIIDTNNNELQKDIVIEKIDKVNPKIFSAIISDITINGFKITANAEDGDATEESIKSGIDRYEYYVRKSDEENYTRYDSNDKEYILSTLEQETTYAIYVVAYDKAGNSTKTEEVEATTLVKLSQLYLISEFEEDGKSVDISKGTEYSTVEEAVNAAQDGNILYFTEGKFEIENAYLTAYDYKVAMSDKGKALTFCRRK